MKLEQYPGHWGATIEHMLQHKDGFKADAFEQAHEIAKAVGDELTAKLLLYYAARAGARDLEIWDHL